MLLMMDDMWISDELREDPPVGGEAPRWVEKEQRSVHEVLKYGERQPNNREETCQEPAQVTETIFDAADCCLHFSDVTAERTHSCVNSPVHFFSYRFD
jgi:hypothetical protein